MKIQAFIPCRLGEPITALTLHGGTLYFGSISGYIGKYSAEKPNVEYHPQCFAELIRDMHAEADNLYVCVGDQYISEHDTKTLNKLEDHPYEDFKHKDLLCGNYFSFVGKSPKTGAVTSLLALFPTTEIERLSELTSGRERERPEELHPDEDADHSRGRRAQHQQAVSAQELLCPDGL